jgi:hypothetical protein
VLPFTVQVSEFPDIFGVTEKQLLIPVSISLPSS